MQYSLNKLCMTTITFVFRVDTTGRKRLVLAPRTVQDPVNALAETATRCSIYGGAKPREEKIKDEEDEEAK